MLSCVASCLTFNTESVWLTSTKEGVMDTTSVLAKAPGARETETL